MEKAKARARADGGRFRVGGYTISYGVARVLRVTVSVRPATHLLRRPGRRRLLDAEIHLLSWDHPLFDAQLGTSLERGVVGRLLVRLAPSGEGTYHLRPVTGQPRP